MAITIIATPGSPLANSFQTIEEIDLYYEGRVPEAVRDEWLDADTVDKKAAAVMATNLMTTGICWTGYQTTKEQSLAWPRNSMWNRNGLTWIEDSVIPFEVKIAHAEFARILLKADRLEESDVVRQGLLGMKAGPISMTFRDDQYMQPPVIPQYIIDFLVPSWVDDVYGQSSGTRELLRS